MTVQDLSQGFANMNMATGKLEQFSLNIAGCVHYNGELLNKLVTRVNTLEASASMAGQQVLQLDNVVAGLTEDIKGALTTVTENDKKTDDKLRAELDTMMGKLEASHAELKSLFSTAPPPPAFIASQPTASYEIGKLDERLKLMGQQLDSRIVELQDHMKQTGARTDVLEMNAGRTTASINEIQSTVTAYRMEVQQVAAGVSSAASMAAAAGAAAQQASAAAADPWHGQTIGQPHVASTRLFY